MRARFGFLELARSLERRLGAELGPAARALPRGLARLAGRHRGAPAALTARAYAGERVVHARFVELEGAELEIANVCLFPRPRLALPVLGVDLAHAGGQRALEVADLSPMTCDADLLGHQLAVLEAHLETRLEPAAAPSCQPGRARACRTQPSSHASAPRTRSPWRTLSVSCWTPSSSWRAAPPRTREAPSRSRSAKRRYYTAAHREHDRGLQLLERIVEPRRAERLVREVLFPERMSA